MCVVCKYRYVRRQLEAQPTIVTTKWLVEVISTCIDDLREVLSILQPLPTTPQRDVVSGDMLPPGDTTPAPAARIIPMTSAWPLRPPPRRFFGSLLTCMVDVPHNRRETTSRQRWVRPGSGPAAAAGCSSTRSRGVRARKQWHCSVIVHHLPRLPRLKDGETRSHRHHLPLPAHHAASTNPHHD